MKDKLLNNIDYKSFIRKIMIILGFTVLIFFLYKIINIIIILIISLFLSVLFSPFLNKLNKWKISDLMGVIIIFILLFFVVTLILFLILPLIISQGVTLFTGLTDWTTNLLEIYNTSGIDGLGFPIIINDFIKNLDIEQILNFIKNNSSQISSFIGTNVGDFIKNGAGIVSSVTSSLFNFVLMIIFTFFIVLERKKIRIAFYSILPKKISEYFFNKEKKVIKTLSEWIKGQLIIAVSMFFITLIGLLILKLFGINIDGTLTLAIIAGFMEFIPYIGTFISFFLALSIALGSGMNAVIGILILYIIIQQLEGNLLVPYIMGKTLSLSPFVVLLSMTIGGVLFGIIGIILTIPVISVIKVFLTPYIKKRKKENYFIK